MVICEHCGEIVTEVWRCRKSADSRADRRIAWVCRECHPSIAGSASSPSDGRKAMADGGVPMLGCPMCGGSTIDGQGMSACTECSWSGTRDR